LKHPGSSVSRSGHFQELGVCPYNAGPLLVEYAQSSALDGKKWRKSV
jgi:hypothetical protein